MDEYEKLDETLKFIKNSNDGDNKMFAHSKDISNHLEIDNHECLLILSHLARNKYISEYKGKGFYSLQYSGLMFMNSGGFKKLKRTEKRALTANKMADLNEIYFKPVLGFFSIVGGIYIIGKMLGCFV